MRKYFALATLLLSILNGSAAYAYDLVEDPYENAWDDTHVKVYYLRRIANASQPDDPQFRFEKDEIFKRRLHIGAYILDKYWGEEYHWYGSWDSINSVPSWHTTVYPDRLPQPHKYGEIFYTPPGNVGDYPEGAVYITDDANDLGPLFEKVAKKIKTRLVK